MTEQPDFIPCQYCGMLILKNKQRCPSCGRAYPFGQKDMTDIKDQTEPDYFMRVIEADWVARGWMRLDNDGAGDLTELGLIEAKRRWNSLSGEDRLMFALMIRHHPAWRAEDG